VDAVGATNYTAAPTLEPVSVAAPVAMSAAGINTLERSPARAINAPAGDRFWQYLTLISSRTYCPQNEVRRLKWLAVFSLTSLSFVV
jgi:hypothetical protein